MLFIRFSCSGQSGHGKGNLGPSSNWLNTYCKVVIDDQTFKPATIRDRVMTQQTTGWMQKTFIITFINKQLLMAGQSKLNAQMVTLKEAFEPRENGSLVVINKTTLQTETVPLGNPLSLFRSNLLSCTKFIMSSAALKIGKMVRKRQKVCLGPLNTDFGLMVKISPVCDRTKNAMSATGNMHLAKQRPRRQELTGPIKVEFRGIRQPSVSYLAITLWVLVHL